MLFGGRAGPSSLALTLYFAPFPAIAAASRCGIHRPLAEDSGLPPIRGTLIVAVSCIATVMGSAVFGRR